MSEAVSVVGATEASGDVRSPLVKWWDMPLILTVSGVGTLVLVLLAVFSFAVAAIAQGATAEELQAFMLEPDVIGTIGWVFGLVSYVLAAGTIVLITRKRKYELKATYFRPVSFRDLLMGLGVALALILFFFVAGQFYSAEVIASFETFYVSNLANLGLASLVVFGLFAAPLVEEMFFRGVVFTWWREKTNLVTAVVVSSAAFSLIHFYFLLIPGAAGWIASGQVFLLGVLAAVLVIWTRSLWPSIVAHFGYNMMAVISFYFAT